MKKKKVPRVEITNYDDLRKYIDDFPIRKQRLKRSNCPGGSGIKLAPFKLRNL